MPSCEATSPFILRSSIIILAISCYIGYSLWKIKTNRDTRSHKEFGLMLFMLCMQQGSGFIIVMLFSFLHEFVYEKGYDTLSWYPINFIVENVLTMLNIHCLTFITVDRYFSYVSKDYSFTLKLAQYYDEHGNFNIKYFWMQFLYSVIIIGFSARLLSLITLICLNYFNITNIFAYYLYNLNIPCLYYIIIVLYIVPFSMDLYMFLFTDKRLRGNDKNDLKEALLLP